MPSKSNTANDHEYEDVRIAKVTPKRDGYDLEREDGWAFFCPGGTVEPKPGDRARFYGRGIGYPVRGLAINDRVVFYRTPAEEEDEKRERFLANQAEMDAKYQALPYPFRWRIDRFRSNNPEFRWQHEPYEMSCCEDAVRIAETLETPKAVDAFRALKWEEQIVAVTGLYDGHSGNSFDVAVGLARLYLTNSEAVAVAHGALCPLLGCKGYGCVPVGQP